MRTEQFLKRLLTSIILIGSLFSFQYKVTAQEEAIPDITFFEENQKPFILAKPAVVHITNIIEGKVSYDIKNSDIIKNVFKSSYDFSVSIGGTGFIVSSDGYILTNGSTVTVEEDLISKYAIHQTAEDMIKEEIVDSTWLNEHKIPTQDEVDKLYIEFIKDTGFKDYNEVVDSLYKNDYSKKNSITIDISENVVYVQTEYISPLKDIITSTGVQAKVIDNRFVKNDKSSDIAIIKIDGSNLPIVRLNETGDPEANSTSYILGYDEIIDPVYGYFLEYDDDFDSKIWAFGITEYDEIFEIYSTNLDEEHKVKGALVMNSSGYVTGITSYSGVTSDSFLNYIIPYSKIKAVLNENNIGSNVSATTEKYEEALNEYLGTCYSKSKTKIEEARGLYPYLNIADEFLAACEDHIVKGNDKCIAGLEPWMFIVAVGAILLICGTITFILLIRTFFKKKVDYSKQDYFKSNE